MTPEYLKDQLPISNHNFDRHVTESMKDTGYAERALDRVMSHRLKEIEKMEDGYYKFWALVDLEVLVRTLRDKG